jgi:hypothetical protein
MLLAIFAHVIGKVALQNFVDLLGLLEPLPTLFGRLAQIVNDAFRLEQAFALEHPVATHPAAPSQIYGHLPHTNA